MNGARGRYGRDRHTGERLHGQRHGRVVAERGSGRHSRPSGMAAAGSMSE